MKWLIPAKTFLVGEYLALEGGPAVLLTTEPCFQLEMSPHSKPSAIHPDSPAGRWWVQQGHCLEHLQWIDPYFGQGGLGASSAQYLGVFLANLALQKQSFNSKQLLHEYFKMAWNGTGSRPSGYDVLAQSAQGCVFIDNHQIQQHTPWPFETIDFLLLHTGKKLATHEHLKQLKTPTSLTHLATTVQLATHAFATQNSQQLIEAINQYHRHLHDMNSVSQETVRLMESLKQNHPDILAMKGCGAMGADVILLIIPNHQQEKIRIQLINNAWTVLASSSALTKHTVCLSM